MNLKINVNKLYYNGYYTTNQIVQNFVYEKTQVFENLETKDSRKRKKTVILVYDWFMDARCQTLPISGTILQA